MSFLATEYKQCGGKNVCFITKMNKTKMCAPSFWLFISRIQPAGAGAEGGSRDLYLCSYLLSLSKFAFHLQ